MNYIELLVLNVMLL